MEIVIFCWKIRIIKSIIISYQYSQFAAFQHPIKTILKIEQMMTNFLLNGSTHSISGNKISKPKEGGLWLEESKI